ncbi:lysine-specific demethylase 6A-like [Stylophora pistillata]|uniref:lysine-specific demethylase 6A-like n=1 Tax=Stylophora pistillata TaxID=50429 RepID=UPI000C052872|nr:lysine-specific demethylase 6A-like [Stylophora pistillata]
MVSQVDVLSDREKEILSNYDSRLYGFLRIQDPVGDPSLPDLNHKSLLLKGVAFLEKELQREGKSVHPSTFCRLGHIHLLLDDFPKALSAYQRFFNVQQVDYWKDATFLYGLGIVYFNFSAYPWAVKIFQQVLYIDPSFNCSNEVHLRLGIILKEQGSCEASIKHFQMALMDSSPCSLSKVEIRFHLGHLFEMQNKCDLAQEMYETIIESPNTPNAVRANAYKQLGWMYYNKEHLGDRTSRMEKAVQLLLKAIETDPNSGAAWYLIGRCYAMQGKVHDAFTSYRHAIDKSEANADTWCSIGVLYQQQNQPMDALQAYVCAIQLDPTHVAAWTDLGILYEACEQLSDAIACYSAARKYGATDNTIEARVKALQAQLAMMPQQGKAQKKNIPSVDEAWQLPIPAELTTRTIRNAQVKLLTSAQMQGLQQQQLQQIYLQQQQQQQQQVTEPNNAQAHSAVPMENAVMYSGKNMANHVSLQDGKGENHDGLNQASVPASSSGENWSNAVQPQNGQILVSTCSENQFAKSTDSLTQTVTSIIATQGITLSLPGPFSQSESIFTEAHSNSTVAAMETSLAGGDPMMAVTEEHNSIAGSNALTITSPLSNFVSTSSNATMFNSSAPSSEGTILLQGESGTTATCEQSLSNEMHSALLNEINCTADVKPSPLTGTSDPTLSNGPMSTYTGFPSSAAGAASGLSTISPFSPPSHYVMSPTQKSPFHPTASQLSPSLTQPLSIINPSCLSPSSGLQGGQSAFSPASLIPTDLLSPSKQLAVISPSSSSKSPFNLSTGGDNLAVPKLNLLFDSNALPHPPDTPLPPLPTDKLSPQTPSIYVENKKDAFSPALQNLVLSNSNPILVIRGLAAALRLDLSLFSTKTLVETNGEHQVEVRTQRLQASDENWDAAGENKVWLCESSRSYTTIAKYAQYQANSFQESLKEEQDRQAGIKEPSQSDSDSSSSSKNPPLYLKPRDKINTSLTSFFSVRTVVSPGNMLSHIGHTILGMNSVQLYMKIPGCRTPGHQENNNFYAININIGPGDSEWFAIPTEYWGVLHNLCEKNNVNFLTGSWWPILEELYEERVPVYRFIQRPGDLVWLSPGVVHWVQSSGWCNNIAWNVGPLTEDMYTAAIERYEWNKLQGEKSIVAMLHLSWNLARNVKVTERKLFEHIRVVLARSLRYCQITVEKLKHAGIDVVWHGKRQNEGSHYCAQCEVEVFNILFVTGTKKHSVYCQDCARKTSGDLAGFTVLNQYMLEELTEVYNSFKLHAVTHRAVDTVLSQNPSQAVGLVAHGVSNLA